GYGCAICADVVQEFCECDLKGSRVSIQGYGNVGQHAARFMGERGAILTVANDLDGTVYDPDGIDFEKLTEIKQSTGRVTDYPTGEKLPRDAFIDIEVDYFIPAARPDVIDETNAHRVKCKAIIQGANIPCTAKAERILFDRGIISVPDFVANAGGVICASVEFHGGTQKRAFETIEEKVRENTTAVLQLSKNHSQMPGEAAMSLAKQRVAEAMAYRRST
ncbi:MAG: Rossmann-fold NAD(P)-binding domain-containing protein, partial [Planctomycetota bacterium]